MPFYFVKKRPSFFQRTIQIWSFGEILRMTSDRNAKTIQRMSDLTDFEVEANAIK